MSGLSRGGPGNASFVSVSGRTQVLLAVSEVLSTDYSLECHFIPMERLALTGLTGDSLWVKLNTALDGALREYQGVRRRSGRQGPYEVYVDINNISLDLDGVERCAEVLTRMIDVIER